MHRRQYIPGSHVKVSRTELAKINKRLREQKEAAQIETANARTARERAERETAATAAAKIRRGWQAVKRVMTRPVTFGFGKGAR